jgi:superfamily I DNA/RNA helicase
MSQAHIQILKSFDELPFPLGKTTLVDFIKGDPNQTILKRNLDEYNSYGCLYKENKRFLFALVNELIKHGYLEEQILRNGFTIIKRTQKGVQEILKREFSFSKDQAKDEYHQIDASVSHSLRFTNITPEEEKLIQHFDFFLTKYNGEQKRAIISNHPSILCVAGAGSGKTTVLTKRIEFLIKFKGIKEKEILAITFTKKAKEEMKQRLEELGIVNCKVETFNSFCEKILKKHGTLLYTKPVKVIDFKHKIILIREIFSKHNIHFDLLAKQYFSKKQLSEKSTDELFFTFINDMFSILDHFKNKKEEIFPFYTSAKTALEKKTAKELHTVVTSLKTKLEEKGFRDFSDQILHTLQLFEKNPEIIPQFKHVLIDEFQDINLPQLELIKLLNAPNIFAVGDPRQAIYGWRGSNVEYILHFPKEFKNTLCISLDTNYRSDPNIVHFFNKGIDKMKLPPLKPGILKDTNTPNIFLLEQENEKIEFISIVELIKHSKTPRNEIFVLARTNKLLEKFAEVAHKSQISFAIKSEEEYKDEEPKENQIILATVHSIKGMEAKEVYLLGANSLSFPNKVQDNVYFSLVKEHDTYNKYLEELRLFYVAISRAKEKLVISYTGNPTPFITEEMLEHVKTNKKQEKTLFQSVNTTIKQSQHYSQLLLQQLKQWRNSKAQSIGIPSYMIFPNTTLEELVSKMPQSKSELFHISGLGPTKIAKYGDEIIEVITGKNVQN